MNTDPRTLEKFCGYKNLLIIFILVAAAMILLPCHVSAASGGKVGYINLERLVKESALGKQAGKKLEALRKAKQAKITASLKAINDLKLNISESQSSDQEKRKQLEKLNQLIKEYKRMVADAKEEITHQNRVMVAQILSKADGALKKVAKKRKFTIILKDPNAIGYLDESVDITGDVLKELNR